MIDRFFLLVVCHGRGSGVHLSGDLLILGGRDPALDDSIPDGLFAPLPRVVIALHELILRRMNDLDGLVSSMSEMFSSNVDQVGENLWQTLMNFFRNYFRSIADFFNRLFDSMANFGDF